MSPFQRVYAGRKGRAGGVANVMRLPSRSHGLPAATPVSAGHACPAAPPHDSATSHVPLDARQTVVYTNDTARTALGHFKLLSRLALLRWRGKSLTNQQTTNLIADKSLSKF